MPAYQSPYTRADHPPYADVLEAGARYVSRDLVHLIARMVALSEADWIALPTPLDNHPDHCASFTFVSAALTSLAAEPGGATKIPDRLLTYLVHTSRGWPPSPQTLGSLPEPPTLFAPARWFSLALSDGQVTTKLEALETHRTQVAVMETLFRSFARPNELFGVIEREQLMAMAPGTQACGPQPPSYASAAQPTPTESPASTPR